MVCIFGPCADHYEEVATGYKAVFIDTSPSHLPQKSGTRNLCLSYKNVSSHANCVCVLYSLSFAFGREKKSLAPACVCFIVRPFEALVREYLCQCVWLRMEALCAKEARLFFGCFSALRMKASFPPATRRFKIVSPGLSW